MFELIYTSYPRGLKSGRSGFTSVAYTEGIPRHYIQLCESLSGYLFLYPTGHPMYHFNPEIYTHYRFNLNGDYSSESSGKEISVLSRIAVSGRDYTGRENKIAHHIILDADEQLSCSRGPAWEMIHGNLFMDHWNQEPSLLPEKRLDSSSIESEPLFSNIESAKLFSRHAEHAYTLARSAQDGKKIRSFILFDPVLHRGICLPLVAEALNLISPEMRWDVTFNTHFISANMDSDCLWRFCPVDSDSAQITASDYIGKYPEALVIDLCGEAMPGESLCNQTDQISEISSSSSPSELPLPETEEFSETDIGDLQEQDGQLRGAVMSGSGARPLWILLCFTVIAISALFALFSDHTPWSRSDVDKEESDVIEKGAVEKESLENSSTIVQLTPGSIQRESPSSNNPASSYSKEISLSFYGATHKIYSDSDDLNSMKCRIIQNSGMEIDAIIEKPITNDTPDWAIMAKGLEQPVGYLSMGNLSLYYREPYCAIYFDIPTKDKRELIWIEPLKITPAMISRGGEPDTLEIRSAPEMSDLLPSLLSLLLSENLTAVVELKQGDESMFHPLCTLKREIKGFSAFIQLKFTEDEFMEIAGESSSDREETAIEKRSTGIKEGDSDRESAAPFNPDNLFKELRVDYRDNHDNRIHPVLCFTCKKTNL